MTPTTVLLYAVLVALAGAGQFGTTSAVEVQPVEMVHVTTASFSEPEWPANRAC